MNHKHDRKTVLAIGLELFWKEGFHNLGVDKICRETGMTKGAFYNAFKSKEQFLLKSMEIYGDLIVDHLKKQLSKTKSKAFDKLSLLYSNMLIAQPGNDFKGCLVNNMMSELGAMNTTVSKTSDQQFERFINVIEPIVHEAQKEGDFSYSLTARQLSEIIHTTFFGFLTRAKSTKSSTHQLMIFFLNTLKDKKT